MYNAKYWKADTLVNLDSSPLEEAIHQIWVVGCIYEDKPQNHKKFLNGFL